MAGCSSLGEKKKKKEKTNSLQMSDHMIVICSLCNLDFNGTQENHAPFSNPTLFYASVYMSGNWCDSVNLL